jgi:hypothetical protein
MLKMDQRPIVLYLVRMGLAAVVINEDLIATLGSVAISCSSNTHDLRESKSATSNPELTFSEPIHEHNDCGQAALLALNE